LIIITKSRVGSTASGDYFLHQLACEDKQSK
jgi:hypothetical protein